MRISFLISRVLNLFGRPGFCLPPLLFEELSTSVAHILSTDDLEIPHSLAVVLRENFPYLCKYKANALVLGGICFLNTIATDISSSEDAESKVSRVFR